MIPFGSINIVLQATILNYFEGPSWPSLYGSWIVLPMQSAPITTDVVSSNRDQGEVYSMQHYVIKFVSDLRQVCGFLRFPPPIKLPAMI